MHTDDETFLVLARTNKTYTDHSEYDLHIRWYDDYEDAAANVTRYDAVIISYTETIDDT